MISRFEYLPLNSSGVCVAVLWQCCGSVVAVLLQCCCSVVAVLLQCCCSVLLQCVDAVYLVLTSHSQNLSSPDVGNCFHTQAKEGMWLKQGGVDLRVAGPRLLQQVRITLLQNTMQQHAATTHYNTLQHTATHIYKYICIYVYLYISI